MSSALSIKPTLLDRVITHFSPAMGIARYNARLKVSAMQDTGYVGASQTLRSMRNWFTDSGSADELVVNELPTLRERSHDAFRNIPIATSAIRTGVTNVVGTGLKLNSMLDAQYLGMSDSKSTAWQNKTEREFRLFAESKDSDAARTLCFYEQQELMFLSALLSGDAFALLPMIPRRKSLPYDLRIKLVEGHQVSTPDYMQDGSRLAAGIEVDKYGAPVKYHMLDKHPGALDVAPKVWRAVPAFGERTGRRNVLHLFRPDRPGQRRGVPYLAPVLESLKQLGRYTQAELMAAVVGGMLTVFITSETVSGFGNPTPGSETEPSGTTAGTPQEYELGHGSMVGLAPGEKAETVSPGRPNSQFDPFFFAIVKQIGASLEQPVEILLKHFDSSYTASRAAFLQGWKFYQGRRAWLARGFCQPVYEEFLVEAITIGRIAAPGFFEDPAARVAYCRADWIGPTQGQIDPIKEVIAAQKRVENGFSTRAEETAALTGGDFEAKHRKRVKEEKLRNELINNEAV